MVNEIHSFPDLLKAELAKGLPGPEVQWKMASSVRMVKSYPGTPGEDARIAAVLILLFPVNGSIHTLFMQRHNYDGVHGGQISFPGGKKESGDIDVIQTALREAEEETSVISDSVKVIGTLTPLFINVSNMLVTPVIGWVDEKPNFSHQVEEVDFLFEAELELFFNDSILKTKLMEIRGEKINVKYFDYNGHVIWGATSMILNELLEIIKRSRISLRFR
jgi:8-oxo-dGTP pyrophosphatase MutT (NUDIX family)